MVDDGRTTDGRTADGAWVYYKLTFEKLELQCRTQHIGGRAKRNELYMKNEH